MKPPAAPGPSTLRRNTIRKPGGVRRRTTAQRECLALSDPTDCLLEAYDCVARRAYENFLAHGPQPGGEMEDWLSAERELLLGFVINVEESGNFVYAMASVPGATAGRLEVGIEERWLVILVSHEQRVRPKASRDDRRASRTGTDAGLSPEPGTNASRSFDIDPDGSRNISPSVDEDRFATKSVCVIELPADVDSAHSIAVLSDGLLGIRMPKIIICQ